MAYLFLPEEVILKIVAHLKSPKMTRTQRDLWSCCLVSRIWYAASVETLYATPIITGRNFQLFIGTMCPSINSHVRQIPFSTMVRRLDMSQLAYDGSKSLTARLLGRVKEVLEAFVAPQASFGINCLAPISKSQNLRELSIALVPNPPTLADLLRSVGRLEKLKILAFRLTVDPALESYAGRWPPNLEWIGLSGRFTDAAAPAFVDIPASATQLCVESCPLVTAAFFRRLLPHLGQHLDYLKVGSSTLNCDYLETFFVPLPRLRCLRTTIEQLEFGQDFKSSWTADDFHLPDVSNHRLERVEVGMSRLKEHPTFSSDYLRTIAAYRVIPRLRKVVFVGDRDILRDQQGDTGMRELNDKLKALAREDGEAATIGEGDAGVYIKRPSAWQ